MATSAKRNVNRITKSLSYFPQKGISPRNCDNLTKAEILPKVTLSLVGWRLYLL